MTMKTLSKALLGCLLVMFCLSCEKDVFQEKGIEEGANLTVRVTNIQQYPFPDTRAVESLKDCCTRLNFVLYQDGERVKSIAQTSSDSNFGEIAVQLGQGQYRMLVLGHSASGNPSLARPENVQFTNKIGFTDTFYYLTDVQVGDESQVQNVVLSRATTMLRFIVDDGFPEGTARIHFYYTGCSGVLDATTGFGGSVNSKQEMTFDVAGRQAPYAFELYTFAQSDEAVLDVRAVAEDSEGSPLHERRVSDIPVRHNMITEYSGNFLADDDDSRLNIQVETGWKGTIKGTY